jgi:hypothetical protein
VRTLIRAVGVVVLVGLIPVWALGVNDQLPRPGEDPRPMSARIVDPIPLPITGDVRVTTSTPLAVRIEHLPPSAAPPFMEVGRCYFMDFNGGSRWRVVLWRVENVQGPWVRARPVRAESDARTDTDIAWFNTARVSRISDALRCE